MGESPSLLLRRAADKLERLAQDAPQAPWRTSGDGDLLACGPTPAVYTGYGDVEVRWASGMLEWVLAMTPAVATPLANILRGVAFTLDCHPEYAEMERNYIELARSIVGLSVEAR